MANVNIAPMPLAYLEVAERFRPGIPPIFTDGDPSPDDIDLARELFAALDAESQAWYRSNSAIFHDE